MHPVQMVQKYKQTLEWNIDILWSMTTFVCYITRTYDIVSDLGPCNKSVKGNRITTKIF
jgi:hypothetical protein